MLTFDKIALSRQAKELSVVRDTLEKVLRLCEILRFFSENELLKSRLALKGGTAINLLFFDLPRLSVDIDLDYCSDADKEEMLSEREIIEGIILRHMNASGYILSSRSKFYHSLHSFVFEYINAGMMKDNIKIEINYSLRSHVLPISRITIRDTITSERFDVNTISTTEIYATKTVALLTRGAARDLYDMNYMVKSNIFADDDLALYHKCAVFYLAIATESPIIAINYDVMNNITPHKIMTDLKPVIRDRDAFELNDAKKAVKTFIDKNLCLTNEDIAFLTNFKCGNYCPEIIFDEEMLERIRMHPMALWKTRNNRDNYI